MHIGIPKEIKAREGRVALIPPAVAELVRQGHEVCSQSGAGLGVCAAKREELGAIGIR